MSKSMTDRVLANAPAVTAQKLAKPEHPQDQGVTR